MGDSVPLIDQVADSQAGASVTVDELFDAVSQSMLYGRHASACAGLAWAYYGGVFNISGMPAAIASGVLTLTASATNYVSVNNSTGVVSVVTSAPAGWPAPSGATALYQIVVGTDAPTSWTDWRPWNPGGTGGGGGGSVTLTGDVTGRGWVWVATSIANEAVSNAKLANWANGTYKGRHTAGTGDPEDVTVANLKSDLSLSGTNTGDQTITLTGDVTGSGTGSFAATIASNVVTNAKLAQMAAHTFKGNNTGSTANASDLTATQLTAELNAVVGDSGSGGTKGLVPAPGAGDAAAGKFLKADGTFAVPPGSGMSTPTGTGFVHITSGSEDGAARAVDLSTADVTGTLGASHLPNPGASSLGGVESYAAVSHQWINSISTSGVPSSTQPAFSDISGSVAASQLPNPSSSTLGGVQSAAAVSHQWIKSISTSGVPALSQPAESDLSFTDITTNDVSTTKHGFAPKSPNDATRYLDGTGAYSVPAGSGSGSSGGMVRLAQVVTSGSQSTITFSSISGAYSQLKIVLVGRDTGGASGNMRLQINGDSTSGNYTASAENQTTNAANAAGNIAATSNGGFIGVIPGNTGDAAAVGYIEVTLPAYSQTTFQKPVFATYCDKRSLTAGIESGYAGWVWKSTSAITSVTFTAATTAFVDGSIATLYGIA